ncbi:MAG: lipase family protein [Gaiellales bacterium]
MTAKKAILACLGVIAAAILLTTIAHRIQAERRQDALDAFYATPAGMEKAPPGTVFHTERLPSADVVGGRAYRLLYRTQRADGSAAVSGAIAIVPLAPVPADGRPVLAWAHGTIGLGRGCAPSRRSDPLQATPWVADAIANGFAVIATDYAGLGTAGPNGYLLGRAEARDVINAVRALDVVPGAHPSRSWTVLGHSQGGHAAVWAAELARTEMPERPLLGVAVGAPALNLDAIVTAQWDAGIGWGVGAEMYQSWPAAYPNVDFTRAVSWLGERYAGPVADACLGEGVPVPALLGFLAAGVGLPFFDENPMRDPQLAAIVQRQTPAPLPSSLPVLMAQGTADTVVPPSSNAATQEEWCAAGSDLTMQWLGGVGHVQAGPIIGTLAVPWLRALYDGAKPQPHCHFVPPVAVTGSRLRDAVDIGT